MGTKIEGYWDCNQCGTKRIKGRFRNCTSCGKPRGKDTKFYMIETTAAEDQDISEEPDWYCSYCESLNSAKESFCESCGSSREDSEKNYFDLQEEKKKETKKKIEDYKEFYNSANSNSETNNIIINTNKDNSSKHLLKYCAIFGSIMALIGLLLFFFLPKQTTLFVNNKSWQRSIEIEEYKTVRENAWLLPSEGRLVETRREIHHYEQVLDHYENVQIQKSERYISYYKTETSYKDLGNGHFDTITKQVPVYDTRYWTETKQEPVYKSMPVYQTKYYYDIERWVTKEWRNAEGTNNNPYWPEIQLKDLERTGSKREQYVISTTNHRNREKKYELPYTVWNDVIIHSEIEVVISAGQIKEIVK